MKLIKGFTVFAALLLVACPTKDDEEDDTAVSSSSGQVTTISSSDGSDTEGETEGEEEGQTTTGMPGTTGSASTGTMEECAGGRCMAQAPEGWMGPIAIYRGLADGSDVPACGEEGFDSPGLTMLEGYNDPGPAICECECGVNLTAFCNMLAYNYGAGCGSFIGQTNPDTDCDDFEIDGGAYFSMWQSGTANCQADKSTTLPEVQWDARVSSCAGVDQTQECEGGGFCTPPAPPGYNAELCVFAQGDMECPADTYTERSIVYNGADDTRGCGVCWCGTGSATCEGTLDVFSSNDCTGSPLASVTANGGCDATAAGGQSIQVNFTGAQSCPVETPPEPVGEITTGTAFTYCCEPAGG